MSEAKKNTFIAILFASIAQIESSCDKNAQAPGTNDIADGLFQLEYSSRQRRAAGRNREFCATNRPVDTQSLQFQSQCAVSIVEDTVCSWGSYITSSDGYWEKLRNKRAISQLVKTTAQKKGLCK